MRTKKKINWIEILIMLFILSVGVGFPIISWGNVEFTSENIQAYIYKEGFVILCSLLFIFVFIYMFIYFIKNYIIGSKPTTMYLDRVEEDLYYFIDKKGLTYNYKDSKNRYEIGKFYSISKVERKILDIIGESRDKFEPPNKKENYWLNFYTPFGHFKSVLLLPILYFSILIFIVIVLDGTIAFIIPAVMFIAVILYDAKYKRTKKRLIKTSNAIRDSKIKNDYLSNIDSASELLNMTNDLKKKIDKVGEISAFSFSLLASLAVLGAIIYYSFKQKNIIFQIIITPFMVIDLIYIVKIILNIIDYKQGSSNYKKINNMFLKAMIITFSIFFYGLLIAGGYRMLKEGQYLILIPISIGIVALPIAIKIFKKNNK